MAAAAQPPLRMTSLLLLPVATSAFCGHALTDSHGAFWLLNLTGLHQPTDIVCSMGTCSRLVPALSSAVDTFINFCQPAAERCVPADGQRRGLMSGAVTRKWGPAPTDQKNCYPAGDPRGPRPCTRACEVLAAGAVGSSGGDFDFVDPANPRAGFRATLLGALPPPPANTSVVWQPPCGFDGAGNPLPRRVVFEFVCDPNAAAEPLIVPPDALRQPTELDCTTTLRVRTAAACFSFAWQPGDYAECALEAPGSSLATRRRPISCGATGTTSTEGRFCDPATKPLDFELCSLPPPAGSAAGGVGEACAACLAPPANAWERAAAVCSALSLLGLVLGGLLVLAPPGAAAERAQGPDNRDDPPAAYSAPREQRRAYDYNAF